MARPMIQLALDFTTTASALRIAVLASEAVDIIEIGTPLNKAEGMYPVRAIREVCPDKVVLADIKTPDVGGLEAQLAFDAGADIMTVIGGAAIATVREAVRVAKERKKTAVIELTGVRDPFVMAEEWKRSGIDWVVYHREWDAEATGGRVWESSDFQAIARLIDMGFSVTVTGGLNADLIPRFKDLPVKAVIVGRAIHTHPDPYSAAMAIRETVERTW